MKVSELKVLVQALEDLGEKDAAVYYDDGRDGQSSLVSVKARLKRIGDQQQPEIVLVLS